MPRAARGVKPRVPLRPPALLRGEQTSHQRGDALGLALRPIAQRAGQVDVDVHVAVRQGTGFLGGGSMGEAYHQSPPGSQPVQGLEG